MSQQPTDKNPFEPAPGITAFDAYGAYQDLQSEFKPSQAKKAVEMIRNRFLPAIATKDDLKLSEANLKAAFSNLRADVSKEINRLIFWVAGLLVVHAGAVLAL